MGTRTPVGRLSQVPCPPEILVVDIDDPADPRLDDFRDLNSVDRRPDLPGGKGLVIAEGVLVAERMLASRFARDFEEARGFGWTVGERSHDWHRLVGAKEAEITRLEGLYAKGQASAGVEVVLEATGVLGAETVSAWEAAGRVLAEPVRAARQHPPRGLAHAAGHRGEAGALDAAAAPGHIGPDRRGGRQGGRSSNCCCCVGSDARFPHMA